MIQSWYVEDCETCGGTGWIYPDLEDEKAARR